MVVEEDVAVEEPSAKRAAHGDAVNQLAIVESNPERERVVARDIEVVPELSIGPRSRNASGRARRRARPRLERDRLEREAVQMEGVVSRTHVRDRQLQQAAPLCVA